MKEILEELYNNQDLVYKEFTSKSIPNIDKSSIIGVRIPKLRKISKNINNSDLRNIFISNLPHKYHEENLIHGFLISLNKNLDNTLDELENFLPYINNWAVCDTISPKVFKKDLDKVYQYVNLWIKSNEEYKIRFGVVTLLQFFLNDKKYINKINKLVMSIKSESYYVNMAIAWYFSFALIKQYDNTIKIFENMKIKNKWIHNKSIQKAIESYRISDEIKEYLKSLKVNVLRKAT